MDNFTHFVSQANCYSTGSNPCQFPIERDIIQLDDFFQFLFESTIPSPRHFYMTVNSSSHSPVYETTSEDKSPPKLPRVIFFSICILLIISLENIFWSVSTNCISASFYVVFNPPYPFLLALITRVNLVIGPSNLHHAVLLFIKHVYSLYILPSLRYLIFPYLSNFISLNLS